LSKNKSQSSDSKQPYSAWLNNSDCVNKLKTAVEKVGYPLEIAAKRILENNDYYVSHSYYSRPDEDPNTPINEIDIHGTKKVGEFSTKECNISFRLIITGDCKYSSTNDLLVFRSEDINFRLPFPILYNGKGLFEPNSFNHFLFPAIIQNIFEVDVAN
jgi:hypothetical protein